MGATMKEATHAEARTNANDECVEGGVSLPVSSHRLCGGSVGRITPILLAGGFGSRLWPLSRAARPKQFLRMSDDCSLLQAAALRLADPARFGGLLVIANRAHRAMITEQFVTLGREMPRMVVEPVGRGTTAAAAISALLVMQDDPEGLLLLCPTDHMITDAAAFQAAIDKGATQARRGRFVVFGVTPKTPTTAYGYILPGASLGETEGVREMKAFVEKPDVAAARRYVESGMLWNCGLVLVQASTLLTEIARHAPDIVEDCQDALARADGRDGLHNS